MPEPTPRVSIQRQTGLRELAVVPAPRPRVGIHCRTQRHDIAFEPLSDVDLALRRGDAHGHPTQAERFVHPDARWISGTGNSRSSQNQGES